MYLSACTVRTVLVARWKERLGIPTDSHCSKCTEWLFGVVEGLKGPLTVQLMLLPLF